MLIAYRDQLLPADYVKLIAPITTERDEGDQLYDWPSHPGFTNPKMLYLVPRVNTCPMLHDPIKDLLHDWLF
jgi:hypothetical protein